MSATKMPSVMATHVYGEDMKISKLLRRLQSENNGAAALELCSKLEIAVRAQSNATYICRTFDLLMDNMLMVLKQCPDECLEKASTVMGLMGYINRNDFPVYKNYIMKTYQSYKSIRKYVMLALKTTFSCDAVNLDLSVYSERLLAVLKDYLENAEVADAFIAVSEAIAEFSKYYKRAFEIHFTDIVDIIVGWHLEAEQPATLKLQCSSTLQQFAPYFLKEVDFTFGLLGQFLEDIVALGDEIVNDSPSSPSSSATAETNAKLHKQKVEVRIGCFIGAFNSILKSLANRVQFVGIIVGQSIVNEAAITIAKTSKQTLQVAMISEDTIMNINEFFCLLYANNNYDVINLINIEELITLEMQQLKYLSDAPKLSLLYLILCVLRHLRTNLPLTTVTLIFQTSVENPLASIKYTNNDKLQRIFLKVYHEILMIKNVPLLQEAYRHITYDMLNALAILEACIDDNCNASEATYSSKIFRAEATLNFYLTALSVLASQTSSIISMYALHPSILELLIAHCKAGIMSIWVRYPTLHYALLDVLVIHCLRNYNFRAASRLLIESPIHVAKKHALDEKTSPTSENFSMILKFLSGILCGFENNLNITNLNLLIDWLICILNECRENAAVLENHTHFIDICKAISQSTLMSPLKCAKCIEIVLEYTTINMEVLGYFRDAAITMLDSCDAHVRRTYTSILAKLPLSTCLTSLCLGNELNLVGRKAQLGDLMKWYRSTQYYAPLRNKYFKSFLERIDNDSTKYGEYETLCQFAFDVFSKCWVSRQREMSAAYESVARGSCQALALWLEYEAARQCVRNKLRTTLGKPQETFLAIEAIISKYARILSTKSGITKNVSNGHKVTPLSQLMSLQRNTRMLLGFIDSLEKHIYNAAEGTAFAIPALEKPVKTFFRINAHTCNEWLNRIRPSVNMIAMHSMMPELVIRNSEAILRSTNKLNDIQFDHTIITFVWALLCCDEPNTLQGLYIWLKLNHPKAAKRCVWILYAVEQAEGRKEHAADSYEAFLTEHESNLDTRIKDFVVDQLLYCLYYTGQWTRCLRVQARYRNADLKTNGYYFELAEALVNDYENESQRSVALQNAIMDLSCWPNTSNNESAKSQAETFSYYHIAQHLQDACVTHALKWNSMSNASAPLPLSDEVQECIRNGVQELPYHNIVRLGEHRNALSDILILNHVAQKLMQPTTLTTIAPRMHEDRLKALCNAEEAEKSTFLLKYLLWTLLFEQRRCNGPFNVAERAQHCDLYLDVAHSARREGNGNFCRLMLQRFFRLKGFKESLSEIARQLRDNEYAVNVCDADLMRAFSELAKCSYVNSANQIDAISLGAAYCTQIITQLQGQLTNANGDTLYPPSSADMLLTLADWLSPRVVATGSSSMPNNNVNAALALKEMQELLQRLPDISVNCAFESSGSSGSGPGDDDAFNTLIPPAEKAIGKLINASIHQQGSSCEAWFAYGNWCYRWGKRLMESKNTNEMKSAATSQPQRDMHEAIREVLADDGSNVTDATINQVINVLNGQQLSSIDAEEEDIEKSELSCNELIEHALRRIDALADKPSEQLANIIKIWRQTHRRIYVYYEMATKAYFTYLTIGTAQNESERAKPSTINSTTATGDCTPVTVTLRLLRLIVKYAAGLQDVLEEGLRTTPLRPWKVIIPQLFSRLNHHEPYVRKSVSDLLCRLAEDRPHLIIFPAVVGAHQESKESMMPVCGNATFNDNNNQRDTRHKSPTKYSTALSNCFRSLLHTLSQQAPDTVAHVQMLVRELKRVTLLWEEYWVHALSQLYNEYAALFNALELELKKCGGNATEKIIAKHNILRQHIVYDMQRIAAVTTKPADTNYERNFQERYGALIANTITELAQPFNAAKPFEGWLRIKQLYGVFQQRSMRGYASTLKIADLSPVLENMRHTAISMPGVDTYAKEPVYIRSVDSAVHILPTKTKPKKLAFYGSDGRKYTYLFKGLEDLHLDERIMQFLSISNSMMARSNLGGDTVQRRSLRAFKAHHYSVIPLGPQSGLISWVDGVTPLFAIYKKWQQRDAALKQQQNERKSTQASNNSNNKGAINQEAATTELAPPPATRPSELFYSKLTPLLAEQGMKVTDPRKQWPLPILRRVLDELIKETPRDLLAKELWCMANTAADWRKSLCSYASSMSVMSVIGYVIGLGDRHLDNVLINLTSGEIVHIDYNVCFEKGKTLRVPEKVPFRLTPNLEEALGITGIEGTFRLGCEHVLKILRKERETLLTLLEAFVYDPLVDWTVSDDGTTTVAARATSAHAAALSLSTLEATWGVGAVVTQKEGCNNVKLNGPDANEDVNTPRGKTNWADCTRQTLEMRMNELKPSWTQFRDDVQIRLTEIENALNRLIMLQAEIRQEERERDHLTKQSAMIRELEALGTAMGSHALNTITDRYKACKRDEQSFNVIMESVHKYQSDTIEILQIYFGHLLSASVANDLYALQLKLREQQRNVPANEFVLIRTLLEQSGQERLYAQCEFTRKEMDNTLIQQSRCALECIELLQQYTRVMQFYPRTRLLQNRLVKYEQIYGELLNGEGSIEELQKRFVDWRQKSEGGVEGEKAKERDALEYASALEKLWIERNMKLEVCINNLNDHSKEVSYFFDVAVDAIKTFITSNSDKANKQTLQTFMLETLSIANDEFLIYEKNALEKEDFDLIDRQLNFLDMQQQMCLLAFPDADPSYYNDILGLCKVLQSLDNMKTAFEISIPERILLLLEQEKTPEIQAAFTYICDCENFDERQITQQLQVDNFAVNYTVLNVVQALFEDFVGQIVTLKTLVEMMLKDMEDSKFKQFVHSRLSEHTPLEFLELINLIRYKVIVSTFRLVRDNVKAGNYNVRQYSMPLKEYIDTVQRTVICGLPTLFAHMLRAKIKRRELDTDMMLAHSLNIPNITIQELQKCFHGKNYQMQVLLRDHNNQVPLTFDVAVNAMRAFIASNSNTVCKQALQICMLETLSKANDEFLLFEQNTLGNENINLLKQQLNFLEMQQQMCPIAFPDADHQYYDDILTLCEVLQALDKLKTAFELSLPERVVRLFMQDNVTEIQIGLNEICAYEPIDDESMLELKVQNVEVNLVLDEIHTLFDDFESRVKVLKPTVELILEKMEDSKFKQFVQSRLREYTIEEIASSMKYEVIVSTFRLARDNVNALINNDLKCIYDVRQLSTPLRNYINTLQRTTICGLPSLFAHMLHIKLTKLNVQQQQQQQQHTNVSDLDAATLLPSAENFTKNFYQALQHRFRRKNYQMQVLLRTNLTDHCALVGTAHYWLNDIDAKQTDKKLMYGFPKDQLLNSIQTCSQSLNVWKQTMIKIYEDVDEYTAAVTQQLSWALQTNTSLLPLQETFMECVKSQVLHYNALLQSVIQILEYTNALLKFEMLGGGGGADKCLQADNDFLAVLQQFQNATKAKEQSMTRITPVEQSIVQLLDPEGKVDQCWIQNVAGLLDEMTYTVQRKLATLEHEEEALREGLYEQGQQMLPLMDPQMRSDTRHLFKAITKNDRNARSNAAANVGANKSGFAAHARDLQHSLRIFHNKLNELQMCLATRNTTEITPIELRIKVQELQNSHEQNIAGLMELGQRFRNEECDSAASSVTMDSPQRNKRSYAATVEGKQKLLMGNADDVPMAITSTAAAEDGSANDKKAAAITNNNPGEQKRNAYAVSVWKRVRMKLEGRDPDSNRRCTIAEQVDYIIREAMNPDNLAVLYEGWTPWV